MVSGVQLDRLFLSVGQKLREGHSGEAEQILTKTIEGIRSHAG